MADLSPQAQAVLDAASTRWLDVDDDIPAQVAAAALCAAAKQVVPTTIDPRLSTVRSDLMRIAAQLEGGAALAQPKPKGPPIADAEAKKMVAWLRDECDAEKAEGNWVRMTIDQVLDVADLLERLSQPEPQGSGPTNQELVNVWEDCKHAEPDPSFPKPLIFAHAVLARWGRPAVEPVPMSEGLPRPEDCDAEGGCWWWIVDDPEQFPYWIYAPVRAWVWGGYTHWLPHWALPVPNFNSNTQGE